MIYKSKAVITSISFPVVISVSTEPHKRMKPNTGVYELIFIPAPFFREPLSSV